MNRSFSLLACVLAALAISPAAIGQNLNKVEERVEKALKGTDNTPAGELAPPAEPPKSDEGELPPPAPGLAAPRSGYLGVVLEELDGVLTITEVAEGSPAEDAGLKAKDKILAVNSLPVLNLDELGRRMEPVPPGGKLTLKVEREGKETTVVATLGEPPAEPARTEPGLDGPLGPTTSDRESTPALPPASSAATQRASLGITVVTYTGDLRVRSDVPARTGALISMIRPDSPAAREGLPLGGVIVAYDGVKVETAEDLVDLIRESKPGQEVELTYYQGPTLKRKSVTLSAAADPSLITPGYGGIGRDRPLLNRVERAIDGLTRPGQLPLGSEIPGRAVPGAAPAATGSLAEEIALLKARIETLEAKLAELEAKLPAKAPGEGDAGAEPAAVPRSRAPGADDAPAGGAAPALSPPRRPAGAKIGDE